MTPERIRELVATHGYNTNHFLVTYDGFSFFEGKSGVVPYVEEPFAWVAAGEPLAPRDKQLEAWREFTLAARERGKGAVCIPVGGAFVQEALKAGFGALMIGAEPIIELARYPKSGQTWHTMVPTAKQLYGRGARVRELKTGDLSEAKRLELDAIARDWRESRKMVALTFLNRVEPWTGAAAKRYFEITSGGAGASPSAFVAAVPIAPRGGWYLIDVLRKSDTEAGTTELLLLEAMRLLKDEGAREVSLGVAPLAGLENAPETQRASRLGRCLGRVYEQGELFYNFRSLHQFKLKFQPTRWEPSYIVFAGPRLRLGTAVSLLQAFVPNGLVHAGLSGLWRLVRDFELQEWIKARVSPTVVVRSAPSSVLRLAFRCRATATLALTLWVVAASSFTGLRLAPAFAAHWAFSFENFREHPLRALALSPVLHWNLLHLVSNTVLAVVFCGLLEYLSGSLLAALVFVAGAVLANPLTCVFFLLGAWGRAEPDLGASLGILACAGAAASLLKRGWRLALVLVVGSVGIAAATHSWLALDHATAVGVGWLVARLFFLA